MSDIALQTFVAELAEKYGIPGVAVGVLVDGREVYACHGVTSLDNPLPVDEHTIYNLGSVSKSFTATAIMKLAAAGKIDLDATVRTYVPELVLADGRAAATITVRNLLNHTAGLGVRLVIETGDGDDALAGYVARMNELEQLGPVGARASYSQAGYNLLGRIVEKVTGQTFEQAVSELLLTPTGLTSTCYRTDQIMVRRFAVGHNPDADGKQTVAQQWKDTRANNPGGGISSTVSDQLRWAALHLADGRAESGEQVVPAETIRAMRRPTVELKGSSLGDAFGLCWFLKEVAGVATVGHGGSGNGQFAELLTVRERNFAVVALSNAGPDGVAFNQAVLRWALEHYLGVVDRDPEPMPYDAARAAETVGRYEIDAMTLDISTAGAGLILEVKIKPELRAASEKELPADYPPFEFGLLSADSDDYIVTSGAFTGQRGFFSRDAAGRIVGADLAGRMFTRVGA